MSVDSGKYIRKLVSLPHDVVRAIKVYRHQHEIDTESETIRLLIDRGLKSADAAVPQTTEPNQAPEPSLSRLPAPPGPHDWEGFGDTPVIMNPPASTAEPTPNLAPTPRVDVPQAEEPSPTQAPARSDMPTYADLATAVDDAASQLGVVHLGSVEDLRKGLNRAEILRPFLNRGVPRSRLVRWFDQSVIAFNIAMSAPTPEPPDPVALQVKRDA
jgi:hypothetical protein